MSAVVFWLWIFTKYVGAHFLLEMQCCYREILWLAYNANLHLKISKSHGEDTGQWFHYPLLEQKYELLKQNYRQIDNNI